MSKLLDIAMIAAAIVFALICFLVEVFIVKPIGWFRRHIYDRAAPFRSVHGPYLLVLRSFKNRTATTRRITRVIMTPDGQEAAVPDFLREMPDLTVMHFLSSVGQRLDHALIGVSNGTSLNGALRLVYTPEGRWFDAVRILAAHARAIIVIPDDSQSLVQEIAHVAASHSSKVAILMPPSNDRIEFARDMMKIFRIEGIDLSPAWAETQAALTAAGVKLTDYSAAGGILLWNDIESTFSARLPWHPDALAIFVRTLDAAASDAKLARTALRAERLPLLRYKAPAGTELDPSWNRYPFHPLPHIDRLMTIVEQDALRQESRADGAPPRGNTLGP